METGIRHLDAMRTLFPIASSPFRGSDRPCEAKVTEIRKRLPPPRSSALGLRVTDCDLDVLPAARGLSLRRRGRVLRNVFKIFSYSLSSEVPLLSHCVAVLDLFCRWIALNSFDTSARRSSLCP